MHRQVYLSGVDALGAPRKSLWPLHLLCLADVIAPRFPIHSQFHSTPGGCLAFAAAQHGVAASEAAATAEAVPAAVAAAAAVVAAAAAAAAVVVVAAAAVAAVVVVAVAAAALELSVAESVPILQLISRDGEPKI
ncbi:hypothetical protein Mapa_009832 [Marchantia paleacea]|nr:hypothetical protein Mapa_009832 [Marchantia paleacea]